jgi:hypothetical protein
LQPAEFAELVTNATHEVLEAYASGEIDLQAYRNTAADEYKELAIKSIDSYAQTNEQIGKITEEQASLLEREKRADSADKF